jgi:hypothetical protein
VVDAGRRYLRVEAGPFQLALPLSSVRQILDTGSGDAALDPRAIGVMQHSLAVLLGARPSSSQPAVLLFDGARDPVVFLCCRLRGVLDAAAPRPLPGTVACRHPGLIAGTTRADDGALLLVLDAAALTALVDAQQDAQQRAVDNAAASATDPARGGG